MKIEVLKNLVLYFVIFVLMGIVITLPALLENIK